jgi:ABC-type molybdate transport system permease subunit
MNTIQLLFLSSIFAGISIYCFSIYFEDKNTIIAKIFKTLLTLILILVKIVIGIFLILGVGSIMSSAKEKYWDNK